MIALIFIGTIGPNSHNTEELRFVEELSGSFSSTYYLRGAGVKSLRLHQLMSIPSRLGGRKPSAAGSRLVGGSLLIVPLRRLARGLNVRWIRNQLANILTQAACEWTVWIRFPSPELVDAVADLKGIRLVYEPIDLYSAAEDLSAADTARLLQAETKLKGIATVVTGGQLLAERFTDAAGGSHWLPFATDRQQASVRTGLQRTEKTRLGVVGCFDWRVDEALLVSLMSAHPEWELVLAGPRVRPWGKRLQRMPNVVWLGRLPADRVRPVVRDCDVTLIPYRLTDWTRHCLPVKVFEYLVEGKPVVATPLPELDLFKDVVAVASPDGFGAAIQHALSFDTESERERRRQAAYRFTLQDRAQKAVQLIQGKELQSAVR